MLKNILELKGANELSKEEQSAVSGGMIRPTSQSCAQVCVSAPHGTRCGPPHCPGMCTGNGGYVNF